MRTSGGRPTFLFARGGSATAGRGTAVGFVDFLAAAFLDEGRTIESIVVTKSHPKKHDRHATPYYPAAFASAHESVGVSGMAHAGRVFQPYESI